MNGVRVFLSRSIRSRLLVRSSIRCLNNHALGDQGLELELFLTFLDTTEDHRGTLLKLHIGKLLELRGRDSVNRYLRHNAKAGTVEDSKRCADRGWPIGALHCSFEGVERGLDHREEAVFGCLLCCSGTSAMNNAGLMSSEWIRLALRSILVFVVTPTPIGIMGPTNIPEFGNFALTCVAVLVDRGTKYLGFVPNCHCFWAQIMVAYGVAMGSDVFTAPTRVGVGTIRG